MIDIHPPHHGAMTRRDILTHLAIVVAGILIAIGLEQSVEYFHHRVLGAEARSALLDERHQNETSNEVNIFAIKRHEQDLKHDLAVLQALRAHQPLPPGPFIIQRVGYIYSEGQWQNVHQSGTINYLSGNLGGLGHGTVGALGYRYGYEERFLDLSRRSTEELSHASSVLRSPSDPLSISFEDNLAFNKFFVRLVAAHEALPQQEIDAAWATLAEPGNVAALTPAQIDDFERAIQVALSDDDRLLSDCYTIKRNLANNPE